jgi:hypothetical protein
MFKIYIKSSLLIVLVLLSIYQTAMLWFDYPSNRNFFYSLVNDEDAVVSENNETQNELFFPEKISVFFDDGSKTYGVMSLSQSDSLNLVDDSIKVIIDSFEIGQIDSHQIQTQDLWKRPHVMLDLPYAITDELLTNELNVKSKWVDEGFGFERVYIFPEEDVDSFHSETNEYSGIRIVFADQALENMISINIQDERMQLLNDSLLLHITTIEEERGYTYFSTKEKGLDIFVEDVLVPVNGQSFNLLGNLYGDMYFYESGVRDDEQLENFVSYFFINPKSTWSTNNVKEMRFGDLESVVRYTENGLFEYTVNFEIEDPKTSLYRSLRVANEFLTKDRLLNQTEYALDDFERRGDEIVLYYNYKYRNVPLVFNDLSTYSMRYPMEIVVSGNTVTNYRRIMWKSQEIVVQGSAFEVRFQKPIDDLLLVDAIQPLMLTDMYLGYRVDHMGDGAYLTWILESNEERYYVELE